jgi:glutathione S-transferase
MSTTKFHVHFLIVTFVSVLFLEWHRIVEEESPRKIKKIKLDLLNNFCPGILKQLSLLLNLTVGPWIAGEKLTYGDFVLANWLQVWEKTISPDLLAHFPELKAHRDAVCSIPQINAWLQIRPETDL